MCVLFVVYACVQWIIALLQWATWLARPFTYFAQRKITQFFRWNVCFQIDFKWASIQMKIISIEIDEKKKQRFLFRLINQKREIHQMDSIKPKICMQLTRCRDIDNSNFIEIEIKWRVRQYRKCYSPHTRIKPFHLAFGSCMWWTYLHIRPMPVISINSAILKIKKEIIINPMKMCMNRLPSPLRTSQ